MARFYYGPAELPRQLAADLRTMHEGTGVGVETPLSGSGGNMPIPPDSTTGGARPGGGGDRGRPGGIRTRIERWSN